MAKKTTAADPKLSVVTVKELLDEPAPTPTGRAVCEVCLRGHDLGANMSRSEAVAKLVADHPDCAHRVRFIDADKPMTLVVDNPRVTGEMDVSPEST